MRSLLPFMLALPLVAMADEAPDYKFEVSALAGQSISGDLEPLVEGIATKQSNDDAYALLLNINDGYNKRGALLQYELLAAQLDSDISLSGDVNGEYQLRSRYFHFGGTYEFSDADFRPYVAASLGMTHLKAEGNDSNNDWSMGFGAGIKWYPLQWLGMRLDARGFGTFYNEETAIICSGGCVAGMDGDIWWQSMVSGGLSVRF